MTRRFSATPLPDGLLDELLDTARRAPSAGFSQGVEFLVLEGDALARFWTTSGGVDWFDEAMLRVPTLIIPLADPVAYTSRYAEPDKIAHGLDDAANWPVPFWLTDAAMATQNLLLLAEANGLGALLFGPPDNMRDAMDELGVPSHILPIGIVALGHRADDDRPSGSPTTRSRRPLAEVVHRNGW